MKTRFNGNVIACLFFYARIMCLVITLLRRLFIKDYQNVNDPKIREKHGVLSSIFGICTNLVLVVLKLVAAIVLALPSGGISLALVGDVVNNLTDMASSIVSLVSFKAAGKPADKDHPFGHGRIEYIAGLIVSMIVVLVGFELLQTSIESAINQSSVTYDVLTMVVLFIAVVLKLYQAYFNRTMGKIIDSPALKATAVDSLGDSLATTAVLISAIVSYACGFDFLDAYLGIAVALFVLVSGVRMIIETSRPLIGEAAKKEEVKKVVDYALSHEGILGIHDVIIHSYGPSRSFVSFHAEIDSKMDILSAHDMIDNLEEDIRKNFACEVSIHMDPVAVGDEETEKARGICRDILKKLDENITIHDFRLVKGPTHMNIIFDMLVPYSSKATMNEALESLEKGFRDYPTKVNFVVKLDRPFDE